ncbi:hypothetical protein BH23THE1_BH23THE1_32820 [soil metagenome]
MSKSKNVIIFSSSLFVLTFVVVVSLFGHAFNTNMLNGNNNNSILVFAQESVASLANSVSNSNNSIIFNNYENSQVGVSIKYPSNFLIDESNSNDTVKQVSFFPAYDDSGLSPETFISWFNIYVQTFYPPIFYSPDNLSSYLEDRTNAVQENDQDVTIVETSTDSLLAGHPAYKLVTRSYSGNETIDTIEYGMIVDDKLYSVIYEVNTSDFQKSLPIANKMIYSFKIDSDKLSESLKLLTNSTGLAMLKDKVPMLQGILSSLNSSNFTGSSTSELFNKSALALTDSHQNILEHLLNNSSSGNMLNMSSVMNSIPPIDLQSICSIQILADLCNGGSFSHPSFNIGNSLLNNESSISDLAKMLDFSKNSTSDFNLSKFRQLLGPFAMLGSTSPSSPSSSYSPFSSFFPPNESDTSSLNQMFLNEISNGTAPNDTTLFNPFEALFGGGIGSEGNDTGPGFFNNGSFGNDSSHASMMPDSQSNDTETVDILKMLELLQGGGN